MRVFAAFRFREYRLLWLSVATALPLRLGAYAVERGRPYRHPFEPLGEGLRYSVDTPLLGTVAVLVALHCGLTLTYQGLLPD